MILLMMVWNYNMVNTFVFERYRIFCVNMPVYLLESVIELFLIVFDFKLSWMLVVVCPRRQAVILRIEETFHYIHHTQTTLQVYWAAVYHLRTLRCWLSVISGRSLRLNKSEVSSFSPERPVYCRSLLG